MAVVYDSIEDAIEEAESKPHDSSAPSNNTIDCPPSDDIIPVDYYEMLSEGTRIWDSETGRIFERTVTRPTVLTELYMQKAHRLMCLLSPDHAPDSTVRHLLSHVGFGPGQGKATEFANTLTITEARILIKSAARLWAQRGRYDILGDLIGSFASKVRPRIIPWHWRRPQVGDTAIGSTYHANEDFLLGKTEYFTEPSESDAYLTLIRVCDDGTLNRGLVESIAELARPSHERFHIAYVDFLDTFADGRLGHWKQLGTQSETMPGDPVARKPPMMAIYNGGYEEMVTPNSSSWDDFTLSFGLEFEGTSALTIEYCNSGNSETIFSADYPVAVGVVMHFQKRDGLDNTLRLYIDEELVDERTEQFADTQGTIAFRNNVGGTAKVWSVEVYNRPFSTVTLGP